MSLGGCDPQECAPGFPRVSGDEPLSIAIPDSADMFSPRERG